MREHICCPEYHILSQYSKMDKCVMRRHFQSLAKRLFCFTAMLGSTSGISADFTASCCLWFTFYIRSCTSARRTEDCDSLESRNKINVQSSAYDDAPLETLVMPRNRNIGESRFETLENVTSCYRKSVIPHYSGLVSCFGLI